jgi:hypothetical protein
MTVKTYVEESLKAKGIKVTPEEASILQSQWEAVQSLAGEALTSNPDDIALTHDPERGKTDE